ncbi:MAG: chromosome segregation protein SMC [Chthoniobacterales bacterium]
MYLKSIELTGFKSFAQRTTLNLHRGVSAIVGPNGCGKSNVLDAIRWALGEQSAKALRGGEMADVIFSGTDTKQAVGMAEVSLTFAECEKDLGVEFNEVNITRRVYRDGRSDYLLNRVPCRLKDIQMLFMDTGVGRAAYSIMEQGRIDQILSSRPEDRRAIFEEAAGVTKYKAQKKEALRKLEYTDANLLRLTDIMKEVKRQIGSLQRQAGKARRYRALFDELRVLDLHLSFRNSEQLKADIVQANEQVEKLRSIQVSLEEQIESQEFGLADQRHELEALEEEILVVRQTGQDIKNRIDVAINRISFNEERAREASGLIGRYESDVSAAQEKLLIQEGQLEETDHQLAELFESLRAEEERLEEHQREVSDSRARRLDQEREAQRFQQEVQLRENRTASIRGELANVLNQREGSQTRLTLVEQELRQAESGRDQVRSQLEQSRTEMAQAGGQVQSCRDALRDSEHDGVNQQRMLQEMVAAIARKQRSLAERESKLEVLSQLNREGEGLDSGTQAVLRGLNDPSLFRSSVLGVLANSLEVSSEFVPAVEAALDHHLQVVLVADRDVAEAISRQLMDVKEGRAGLVSIDAVSRLAPVQIQTLPAEAMGWALDRVKTRPEIAPLVNKLLGNVALAPDFDTALRITRQNADVAVATPSGEFISERGVVFAGIRGNDGSSVLRRKVQMRELADACTQLQAELDAAQQSQAEVETRLADTHQKISENREALQQAQVLESTVQGQIALLDRELRDVEGKVKSLTWEKQNTEERLRSATAKTGLLESELTKLGEEAANFQERLGAALAQVEALRGTEESLVDSLNELKVRVATERQRREDLNRQRQPLANRIVELQELISSRQGDVRNYLARIEQLEQENDALQQKNASLQQEQEAAELEVERLTGEKSTRVASVEAVELNLRQLRKQLIDHQEQRGEQEVRSTQFRLRLDSLLEQVQRRYQIDLNTFQPEWEAFLKSLKEQRSRLKAAMDTELADGVADIANLREEDWESTRAIVSEMTERLDGMGPVNLESIQEYDELEERQRFLENQHNDLVKAKGELLDIINQINATTQKLFAETFEEVRKNFQEMFSELFGGGKANLLLIDDADPLESGIEIIAKPPGKQLQSITLLSGGEKTMTAVALLFSVYMVKPSPFCVLDEMDAPLDESNINRFIKILDRFVHQSQFVVITHNKRTIAKADVLYGVTMEEHGISKLVGVRLTKREEEPELEGTAASNTSNTSEEVPVTAGTEEAG